MEGNERLTDEQLAEIRKRAEKATAGIWFKMHRTDICVEEPSGSCEIDSIAYADREIDAEFIAHARQDVPKLLAEIERLRELNMMIGTNNVIMNEKVNLYEGLALEHRYQTILDEMEEN